MYGNVNWLGEGIKKEERWEVDIIMGIRKNLVDEPMEEDREAERLIIKKLRCGKERWRVVGVYVNGDMEKKLRDLRGWIEEKQYKVRILIVGDFNAKTKKEEGSVAVQNGEREETRRESKDKKINREEKKLIKFIGKRGWTIINGGMKRDEKGEWTYTKGRGESVINYYQLEKYG